MAIVEETREARSGPGRVGTRSNRTRSWATSAWR